jgi:ubiquinone/menaquinone biosynthesis C-methylase UbiE
MTLARVLEPEVMASEEEAHDYDAMDHSTVNARFCEDLLALRKDPRRVLDVGTGTAQIPVALLQRSPKTRCYAMDLSVPMIARGLQNVQKHGFSRNIALILADATGIPWEDAAFEVVMCNSIVHHIPEPAHIFAELVRVTAPGGLLFVRDLARPANDGVVKELVAQYATVPATATGSEKAMYERQRDLFEASLRAGLRQEEVQALVAPLGVPTSAVTLTSDRHWTLSWMKPA